MLDTEQSEINKTFERALKAKRDVSPSFWQDYGFDHSRAYSLLDSENILRRKVREFMISGNNGGRLFNLSTETSPHLDVARNLLLSGDVAAVDGTPALAKIDFMMTTQYACAVGWITSQSRGVPHITITETISDYLDPEALTGNVTMLADLYELKNEARVQESWPTTFREYEERRIAMDVCATSVVLLDGPVFTQNLMTQDSGRKLYDDMLRRGKHYIGIIKNLSGSWPECVWSAGALERGEGYVICPVGEPVIRRGKVASNTSWISWVSNSGVNNYVRVVYRPAEKAFAFECEADRVGLSCSILLADASPTLNHEIPLLMETIDAQLRSGFNAAAARDMILARHMTLPDGYRSTIDATNERDFR